MAIPRYSKLETQKLSRPKKNWPCILLSLLSSFVFFVVWLSAKNLGSTHPFDSYHPHQYRLPYGEHDDLRRGKSCTYNKNAMGKKWKIDNYWLCQECFINDNGEEECKPLKRRGRCRSFPRYIDSGSSSEIPRVHTAYSPYTTKKSAVAVWTHDGHMENAKRNVPICSGMLTLPCFDLSRCESSVARGKPIAVYSHGGVTDELLDFAATQHPTSVKRVHNASEACLLVLGLNSYETPDELVESPHWTDGQNHYIFEASRMFLFDSHGDRPFNDQFDSGMASSSRSSMDDAWVREGYDVPLMLVPRWTPPVNYKELSLHRHRQYLLSFKGNIMPWEQRSWQHRWVAAEYWHEEKNVHVDAKCETSPQVWSDYENTNATDFGNLLLNSTFFFCPGGGGTHSFRFAESLLGGAIPVVTSEFVPPFYPEIDWSGCIVQVSEARVVDVPRLVGEISQEEVIKRQLCCAVLAETLLGNDPVKQMFSMAMQIWHARVSGALRQQDVMATLIPPQSEMIP